MKKLIKLISITMTVLMGACSTASFADEIISENYEETVEPAAEMETGAAETAGISEQWIEAEDYYSDENISINTLYETAPEISVDTIPAAVSEIIPETEAVIVPEITAEADSAAVTEPADSTVINTMAAAETESLKKSEIVDEAAAEAAVQTAIAASCEAVTEISAAEYDAASEKVTAVNPEAASTEAKEDQIKTSTENNQDIQSRETVKKLEQLPVQFKAELPKAMSAGDIVKITVEIKNITNKTFDNMIIRLKSKDDHFFISSFSEAEEAEKWLDGTEAAYMTESEIQTKIKTCTINIGIFEAGTVVKKDIYIVAEKNFEINENGVKAYAGCELSIENIFCAAEGGWKIIGKKIEEIDAPAEVPVEEAIEAPAEAASEEAIEVPAEIPAEKAADAPAEVPAEETADASAEVPAEETVPAPVEVPAEETVPVPVEVSIEEVDTALTAVAAAFSANEAAEASEETAEAQDEMEQFDVITSEDEFESSMEDFDIVYDDWSYYSGGGFSEETVDTATPHILIKSYAHKKVINTGDSFVLEVTLLNTSQKLDIEGAIVKIETGESLSLANGTNTIFINNLSAGSTTKQSINLIVSKDCKASTLDVKLSISYEYIDNKQRKTGTSDESISIPVAQKTRLEIADPVCDEMQEGSESVISLDYVNKGYTALNNLEAAISIDGFDISESKKYVGNIESGNKGTIDFLVTPMTAGKHTGTITLKFENSSQEEVTEEIPVEIDVAEMPMMEDYDFEGFDEYTEETPENNNMLLIYCIAGAAALGVIITVIVVSKKKKAKREEQLDDEWFNE